MLLIKWLRFRSIANKTGRWISPLIFIPCAAWVGLTLPHKLLLYAGKKSSLPGFLLIAQVDWVANDKCRLLPFQKATGKWWLQHFNLMCWHFVCQQGIIGLIHRSVLNSLNKKRLNLEEGNKAQGGFTCKAINIQQGNLRWQNIDGRWRFVSQNCGFGLKSCAVASSALLLTWEKSHHPCLTFSNNQLSVSEKSFANLSKEVTCGIPVTNLEVSSLDEIRWLNPSELKLTSLLETTFPKL